MDDLEMKFVDLEKRLSNLESRISDLNPILNTVRQIEIKMVRIEEGLHHRDDMITNVNLRLDEIENVLKWVFRGLLTAVISGGASAYFQIIHSTGV